MDVTFIAAPSPSWVPSPAAWAERGCQELSGDGAGFAGGASSCCSCWARLPSTLMRQGGSAEVQHRAGSVQCPLALCCWQSEHRCTHVFTLHLCISEPQTCKEKFQKQLPFSSPQ